MMYTSWACQKCMYMIDSVPTDVFVKKCPRCGTEYEVLGEVRGYHVAHVLLMYRMKGRPLSTVRTNAGFAFDACAKKPVLICYTEEFYEFAKKHLTFMVDVKLGERPPTYDIVSEEPI